MFDNHKPLDPRELIVSQEVRNQRLNICKSCEKFNKISFCSVCNCFMPVKTWLLVSDCPIKKWQTDN
jgi:hypothetical protein